MGTVPRHQRCQEHDYVKLHTSPYGNSLPAVWLRRSGPTLPTERLSRHLLRQNGPSVNSQRTAANGSMADAQQQFRRGLVPRIPRVLRTEVRVSFSRLALNYTEILSHLNIFTAWSYQQQVVSVRTGMRIVKQALLHQRTHRHDPQQWNRFLCVEGTQSFGILLVLILVR